MKHTAAYTYCIVDKRDNSVIYVGKTVDTKGRWNNHVKSADKHRRFHCANHMKKHGVENFEMQTLYTFPFADFSDQNVVCIEKIGCPCSRCVSESYAYTMENTLIEMIRTGDGDLTNLNDGGTGGMNPSAKTRALISEASKGNKSAVGNKGHKHTDEVRAKIGAKRKGFIVTDETRAKLRAYKHTDETRAKIGAKSKGNKHCLGRVVTVETRKNMSEAKKGKKRLPFTDETRTKMRMGALNKPPVTDETRMKMSEAGKRRCARERCAIWFAKQMAGTE